MADPAGIPQSPRKPSIHAPFASCRGRHPGNHIAPIYAAHNRTTPQDFPNEHHATSRSITRGSRKFPGRDPERLDVAYIRKDGKVWRVQIERKGVRKSGTFRTKSAADQWAAKEEAAILDGLVSKWPRKTVADAFDKYSEDVSSRKRSGPEEVLRLQAVARGFPALAGKIISEVTTANLAAWRDARLSAVKPSSVQREINLLRNVWAVAAREWQWLPEPTPWRALKLPAGTPPRDRLMTWREIRLLLRRMGYVTGQPPVTPMEATAWALLISLRTAMRAGEVLSLSPATVNLQAKVATLESHKTAEHVGRRRVPLTRHGVRLLSMAPIPLPVKGPSLDALFRKARDQLMLRDLHFHDARATALTHLARKVDVMTLARISGHTDLRVLMSTYYRETAEQIAARL